MSAGSPTLPFPSAVRMNTNQPVLPLTLFQRSWIEDSSRYKIAVKSRRAGFTFAATLEIALDALNRSTRWMIISRTQDTAKEALREVANHLQVMKLAVRTVIMDTPIGILDGVEIFKFAINLPNGSEILAMTAHPDAARGFGGNVLLDEHGFHENSTELWKAAFASTLRGHRLLVISTPNYQIGNFYKLARQAGLVSGRPPSLPIKTGIWSAHWVDIFMAAPQLAEIGVPIDLNELRELAGDDEAWQQEFCCSFLSATEMWLTWELIAGARSPSASMDWDPDGNFESSLYIGGDIGRRRDRTAIWIDQRVGEVAICRGVILLDRTPFEQQFEIFSSLLRHPKVRRACLDETGIGMALVERLQRKFGGKVEGITFTREIKETMSVNVRHRFEERLDRIPDNAPEVERDLAAIKRLATPSGNLRFDADRNDHSHADIYWAKALADLAADQPTSHLSDGCIVGTPRQREMQLMRLAGKVF
jgi:phage FluMu gp28-like protein